MNLQNTFLASLLSLLVISCQGARAVTLSVCVAEGLPAAGASVFHGPAGEKLALVVNEQGPPAPDCSSLELPVNADQVQWFAATEIVEAPASLTLQGRFDRTPVVVSEVIYSGTPTPAREYLPLADNLLSRFVATPFGEEERSTRGTDNQLVCLAGQRPAGMVLRTTERWPRLPAMQLLLKVKGQGQFEVAIADSLRDQQGRPLSLGRVEVSGSVEQGFRLPANTDPWSALTLLCPKEQAQLTLEELELQIIGTPAVSAPRSTWLWLPSTWQEQAAKVWALAEREQLTQLYITVPVTAQGVVEQAASLREFVRAAHARQLKVWAVAGDREDVLPVSMSSMLSRVDALLAYNSSADAGAALDGLQLDIEPYLLPGYALAPEFWRERYLATISAVHSRLNGQLPLDLVVPVWWGEHPHWGEKLFKSLELPGLSVTVMNYRTNAPALRAGAMPFIEWSERAKVKVAMALEYGGLSTDGLSETRQRFQQQDGNAGQLLLVAIGGVNTLVLLDKPQRLGVGHPYLLQEQREFSNANISLQREPDKLKQLADTLNREWLQWPHYGGLAIHGLEEHLGD